jgi:hypothetical protein
MGYLNSSIGVFASGSGTTSCLVPIPTGTGNGVFALAWVYVLANNTVTPPTGFQALTTPAFISSRGTVNWFYKQMSVAETGSNWSFVIGGATQNIGWCTLLSGREMGANPFDFTPVVNSASTSSSGPAALSGTATAGSDAVYGFDEWNGNNSTGPNVPNFTARINDPAGAHLWTEDNLAAGTVTAQAAANGSNNFYWTTLAVVKAAAATTPVGWPGEAWS